MRDGQCTGNLIELYAGFIGEVCGHSGCGEIDIGTSQTRARAARRDFESTDAGA